MMGFEWVALVSCIYSHTFAGMFYCSLHKDLDMVGSFRSEEECEKHAKLFVHGKFELHKGQYAWQYKCVFRVRA